MCSVPENKEGVSHKVKCRGYSWKIRPKGFPQRSCERPWGQWFWSMVGAQAQAAVCHRDGPWEAGAAGQRTPLLKALPLGVPKLPNSLCSCRILKPTPQDCWEDLKNSHEKFLKIIKHQKCINMYIYIIRFLCVCMRVHMLSLIWLFATPWTLVHQVPLSMGFSRKEYWRGLLFPAARVFPIQGSIPCLLHLLDWKVDSLPLHHLGLPSGIFSSNESVIPLCPPPLPPPPPPPKPSVLLKKKKKYTHTHTHTYVFMYLFIYFWLEWVSVAAQGFL